MIDRTFVDENNYRWIIDYKTGQHIGSDLEIFFKNEKNPHKIYYMKEFYISLSY